MKILVFDYDGTIIDSLDVVMEIYNKVGPRYNIKQITDKEEFTKLYDNNFYDSMENEGYSKETISKFVIEINKEMGNFNNRVKLFDSCDEIINTLTKSNKVIVVTSNATDVIKESIKANKINVEDVIGADIELSKVKKIKKIKEQNPNDEVIYIGDTVGDVKEAKEAGVKVVAVSWGYHDKNKLKAANPDILLNEPKELLTAFS